MGRLDGATTPRQPCSSLTPHDSALRDRPRCLARSSVGPTGRRPRGRATLRPEPRLGRTRSNETGDGPRDPKRTVLQENIEGWVGTPYRFGSKRRRNEGIDCSGFFGAVFLETFEIHVPRTTRRLAKDGASDWRADLVPRPRVLRRFSTGSGHPCGRLHGEGIHRSCIDPQRCFVCRAHRKMLEAAPSRCAATPASSPRDALDARSNDRGPTTVRWGCGQKPRPSQESAPSTSSGASSHARGNASWLFLHKCCI